MLYLLAAVVILYGGFICYLYIAWRNVVILPTHEAPLLISILIPIRNEAKHIEKTLQSILSNNYTQSGFEVIVIDDHSDDHSKTIVEKFAQVDPQVKYLSLPKNKNGKKQAITWGVGHAQGEVILCTDGDIIADHTWISQHAEAYHADTVMAFGPVLYDGGTNRFVQNLLNLELIGLVGIGAATLQMGKPSMINGCNYSFRKSVFLEVNGFEQNQDIPTGDDEFLLRKVHERYPKGIQFLKTKKALVKTNPLSSFVAFYNQRRRWASKWKSHNDSASWVLPSLIFIFYLLLIISGVYAIANKATTAMLFIALKILGDYIFINAIARILRLRIPIFEFALLQIIYPFYVVFFGIASNFGNYTWKNRSYKI